MTAAGGDGRGLGAAHPRREQRLPDHIEDGRVDAEDRARHRKACLLADVLEPLLAAGGWRPYVLNGLPRRDVSLDLVWAIAEHAAGVRLASHATASYSTRLAVISELHRRARVAAAIADDPFGGTP